MKRSRKGLGEKRFRALQTGTRARPAGDARTTRERPHAACCSKRHGSDKPRTICTSSSIRTITVGSGIAPDLLTPRSLRSDSKTTATRALAGSQVRIAPPAYRRWGIAPRPEDVLIAGIFRRAKHTTTDNLLLNQAGAS
jgi:hypothetical protein